MAKIVYPDDKKSEEAKADFLVSVFSADCRSVVAGMNEG